MLHQAIYNTHPTVVSICDDIAFDAASNSVILNQSAVDAEVVTLQAASDSKQYARDRATAYPPMADQLDDIFHNGVAGWKETIQAVKDTYPKP